MSEDKPPVAVGVIGLGPNKNGDHFSDAVIRDLAGKLIGTEVKDQDDNPTGRIIAASGAEGRDRLRVTIEHIDRSRTDAIVMLENPNIPSFSMSAQVDALTREVENLKPLKTIMNEKLETPIIPQRSYYPRGLGILGLLAGSLGIPFAGIPRSRTTVVKEKSPEEVAASLRASDDHRRNSSRKRGEYNKRRAAREYKAALHNRTWAGQPNMRPHMLWLAERAGQPLSA